jgi:hypothetical protein
MTPPLARYVTLRTATPKLSVTVLRGDTPPVITGGYGGWENQPRPHRQDLTVWKGRAPFSMDLPLLFDDYIAGGSVETPISVLERMALPPASGKEPPVVAVTGAVAIARKTVPHSDLRWVIQELVWGDALWSTGGYRTRAAVTVKLLHYVAPDRVQSGTAAGRARLAVAGDGGPKAFTVGHGDTLSSVAARELGDYTRWPEIADLNGLRDPDRLTVGQTLRLP